MPFHHGLTLTESATGPRALAALSSAVIGIIATATTTGDASAQDALDAAFPLNEPVLITGGVDIAAGNAGDGGTLAPTLTAIGDQASPIVHPPNALSTGWGRRSPWSARASAALW